MSFNAEEIKHIQRASNDFVYFVNHIFSKSVKTFVGGPYVDETSRFLGNSKKTIRVSARKHFKSFAFYAHFMWKLMFEGISNNLEAHYFSFNNDLAGYHIGKIKLAIAANPYFRDVKDLKTAAESVIKYSWQRENDETRKVTSLAPHGLVQFKRGIHCLAPYEEVIVRDPISGDIRKTAIKSICTDEKINDEAGSVFSEILTENGFKKITHFFKRTNKDEILKITLNNGSDIKITPDHPCLIKRNNETMIVSADELKMTDMLPYKPQIIYNEKEIEIGSYELGRFVGIYIGDGSRRGAKGLQFVNNPKKGTSLFLKNFAEKNLGVKTRTVDFVNYERFFVQGKAAIELVSRFCKGSSSRTKRLTNTILNTSINFRRGLIDGMIESDGTGEKRFGSSSKKLAEDFCIVANSLGMHYSFHSYSGQNGYNDMQRTMYTICLNPSTPYNNRPIFNRKPADIDKDGMLWLPIKTIENSNRVPDYVYDVRVDSDTHLFSLANGIITHNCDLVYVDDPFQDPENELNPSIIYKINEIFKSNILDMPNEPDGELHVCGTLQTSEDFFFDKNVTNRFDVRIQPAITDEGLALWPEWMDLKELELKRIERTDRVFQREYLCTPVYSTKAFFNKEDLIARIVNKDLVSMKITVPYRAAGDVIAGYDIGKKTHPSHFSVFEERDGKFVMIHQKFMDGWSYSNGKEYDEDNPTQLEYIKLAIRNFQIREIHFDNTRGEYETFNEQGLLPPQFVPVSFSTKSRSNMSTIFDRLVERRQIEIVNDQRLINQICSVTNDLNAIASVEGHGDAFWSCALAFLGKTEFLVYSNTGEDTMRRKIMTGGTGLFDKDTSIPQGW